MAAMDDAKSDLVNVLARLEAHWVVLEAELVEINKDITFCEQCMHKYGEYFTYPLQHLRELKRTKKGKMKDIIKAMESFNDNLVGGKKLVKALERDTPIGSVGQSFGHKASGQGGPNGAVPGTGTGSSMVMRGQGMGSNIDTGGRASQTNAAAGGANSSGVGKGMFGGFNFPMERQDNA